MIEFSCAGCSAAISAPVEHVGQQCVCPHCNTVQLVPNLPPVAAPQAGTTPVDVMATGRKGGAMSVTGMVLGICGIVPFLGVVLGPIGAVLSTIALVTGRRGKGKAIAGVICGLLCTLLQVGFVLAMSLTLAQAQDLAKRAACGANLNGIGKAIVLYQASNDDRWPLISNIQAMNYDAPMSHGGSDDVFELDGVEDGQGANLNINENLCVLIDSNMVTSWKMFRCPRVSGEVMDRSYEGNYGFKDSSGEVYLDYAYHNGYRNTVDGDNQAPFSYALSGNFAILADQPGDSRAEFGGWNDGAGWNHDDDGVNVLYADSHISWHEGTIQVGWGDNNIYTVDIDANDYLTGGTSPGTPVNNHDSVLIRAR